MLNPGIRLMSVSTVAKWPWAFLSASCTSTPANWVGYGLDERFGSTSLMWTHGWKSIGWCPDDGGGGDPSPLERLAIRLFEASFPPYRRLIGVVARSSGAGAIQNPTRGGHSGAVSEGEFSWGRVQNSIGA